MRCIHMESWVLNAIWFELQCNLTLHSWKYRVEYDNDDDDNNNNNNGSSTNNQNKKRQTNSEQFVLCVGWQLNNCVKIRILCVKWVWMWFAIRAIEWNDVKFAFHSNIDEQFLETHDEISVIEVPSKWRNAFCSGIFFHLHFCLFFVCPLILLLGIGLNCVIGGQFNNYHGCCCSWAFQKSLCAIIENVRKITKKKYKQIYARACQYPLSVFLEKQFSRELWNCLH